MVAEISLEELSSHKTKDDLWIAVEGKVYDITRFQVEHPGGSSILKKVAGTDATKHFLKFHPNSVLRLLDSAALKGDLGKIEVPESADKDKDEQMKELEFQRANKPSIGEMCNLFDFEAVARKVLDKIGWYYFSSGADDEMTLRENHRAFQRIWFRPKILVDVGTVNYSTTMLGQPTSSPFYITATALAKLGHPDGETVLTKAAGKKGVIQMLSTLSSCSIEEVMDAAISEQTVWQQVYVNADREHTRKFMQHSESLGVKGFFVTVDAPHLGRREKDIRGKYDPELEDSLEGDGSETLGVARSISTFIDPKLSWKDIPFLRACTSKPLLIKGVQRWEDAVLAAEHGLDGIVLSNHGGRQLEFSRSAIEVLAEVMHELRKRNLNKKMEVYIDGGVRRGTDVLKALCLGAKGVGIGRPFIYAMSSYGVEGVVKAIQLLNDEIDMNMRLLGVTELSHLGPDMVDIKALSAHDAVPNDYSSEQVYERLLQPQFKHRL